MPLRYRDTQEALWQALARGDVDVVGSDHVVAWPPADREAMYRQSIWDCRTGFSRVETFLPVMLTHGVHEGRISLERLVQVCCENPARIYGLFPRKGTVAVGSDADLVVVDLSREVTVGPEHLNTRAGWSIMEGKTYHGWPVLTLLGGRVIAEWADDAPGPRPVGEPAAATCPGPSGPTSPRNPRTGWSAPGPTPPSPASARDLTQGGKCTWRSGTTSFQTPTARSSRPPDGAGRRGSASGPCCC